MAAEPVNMTCITAEAPGIRPFSSFQPSSAHGQKRSRDEVEDAHEQSLSGLEHLVRVSSSLRQQPSPKRRRVGSATPRLPEQSPRASGGEATTTGFSMGDVDGDNV